MPKSIFIPLFRIFFILIFIVLTIEKISAQDKKPRNNSTYDLLSLNENIIPGVLILKLKPEFRDLTNNSNALFNHSALSKKIQKYGVKNFNKLIPKSKVPSQKYTKKNTESIDLSLIHVLEFDPTIPIGEIIQTMESSGLFLYVEPQFKMHALYMPNDPIAQPGGGEDVQLERINAYKAWDVEQGDPNVVIGVLDTGIELTHPDIVNNIKYNLADPINGSDDDGDGYVDNYYGWDVGSNDNDPTWQVDDHGLKVQGACSATPDNNIGVIGTGFNCTSLPIKISNSGGAITKGYEGIIYAADHGVKVMNLSWGGYGGFSQAGQDIIDYAAIDNDVLIIAAAGNTEGDLDFYPASYNNVFSVTGLETIYSPANDTIVEMRRVYNYSPLTGLTYSFKVDLACLEAGWTTTNGGTYNGFGGSSYASPVVAGAAGLVRSRFPLLSGVQAGELLRVTGEILDTFDITRPEGRYKIGRKLNMYNAVTNTTTPSVRMTNYNAAGPAGIGLFSGDTITMTQDFFNYLSPTNNLTIRMLCNNGYAKMVDSISNIGIIDSLMPKNNVSDPFKFVINDNAGSNQVIEFVLIMTDPVTNYYDYQGFKITVNPAYLNIDTNLVKMTITSKGRIGFAEFIPAPDQGIGVDYLGNSLLYEGGFMIGTSVSKVSDCVRESAFIPTVNDEFKSKKNAKYIVSSTKDMESYSIFNDSLAASIIGVEVHQKSYAWKNSPNDKFVILEYQIINKSSITYDSIFPGIFADWDIDNYLTNRADWNDANKVSFTYSSNWGYKVAGVALLTDNAPSCYSLDLGGTGGSINSYDVFTTSEKFNTLAKGVSRKKAGVAGSGNEVSQVTGAKITNFAPGDTETVAFAIVVADDVFQLLDVAAAARTKFVSINKGDQPITSNALICRNETTDVTFAPPNGNKFAFYDNPPPASPLFIGPSYTYTNQTTSNEIYIENRDFLFPSDLSIVQILVDDMTMDFYPFEDTIFTAVNIPTLFVNQSTGTSSISWDFGDGNTSSSNIVSKSYSLLGDFIVNLSGISPLGCEDTIRKVVRVSLSSNSIESSFMNSTLTVYPNPVQNELYVGISSSSDIEPLSIELINNIGSSMMILEGINSDTKINMSAYPAGVYYIKFKSGKNTLTKMIMKN